MAMMYNSPDRSPPRIAIVSDIHGNYEALKALLNHYDELWELLSSGRILQGDRAACTGRDQFFS